MPVRSDWEGEGEHCTKKDGCMNCDMRPAKGIYFKRAADERYIFICDHCGYKDTQGWSTKSHSVMVEKKEQYEYAYANRDRYRRERTEKFNEEWDKATENLKVPPDGIRDFYDTVRPNFDKINEREDTENNA